MQKQALEQELVYQAKIRNDAVGIATKDDKYTRFKSFKPADQDAIDEYNETFLQKTDERGRPIGKTINFPGDEALPELQELPTDVRIISPLEEEELRVEIRDLDKQIEIAERWFYSTNPRESFTIGGNEWQSYQVLKKNIDEQFNTGVIDQPTHTAERADLEVLKTDIQQLIDDAKTDVDRVSGEINDNEAKKLELQAEVGKVRQSNKERLESFRQQLELSNAGAFRQVQQPGETEEEFLKRLKDIGATTPTEILDKAQRFAIKNFKLKLKELFRDPVKIEQVANEIGTDREGIEMKVELLKIWPKIKKKFIDRFGYDNIGLTKDDIIEELNLAVKSEGVRKTGGIEASLQTLLDRTAPEPVSDEQDYEDSGRQNFSLAPGDRRAPAGPPFKIYKDNDSTIRIWSSGGIGNSVFLKLAQYNGDDFVLFSKTGEKDSFIQILPTNKKKNAISYEAIASSVGLSIKQFMHLVANSNSATTPIQRLYDNLESEYNLIPQVGVETKKVKIGKGKTESSLIGWGLHAEHIPERISFGEIDILGPKLFYDNTLSVRKGSSTVPYFKTAKVSDKFVKIIMEMTKPGGRGPDKEEIDRLEVGEAPLFTELLHIAKLHKKVPIPKMMGTGVDERKRLQVLEGEIRAGNDSPKMVEEIYVTLKKLISLGEISKAEARKYMSQFQ